MAAPIDSTDVDSRLAEELDRVLCLIDNCNLNDHSNCGTHPQYLRRTRPHMLAYFSTPKEEPSNQSKPVEHYGPQSPQPPSKVVRDRQRVKDLELTLRAITKLRNSETKNKAINRVNEWRVEQASVMNADKSLEDDRRSAPTDSYRVTMQELMKLHNAERDRWKLERDKWRIERDSWKLACKRLKENAVAREEHLRKLSMESMRGKAMFTRLASADTQGKNVAEVCWNLVEQLRVERQTWDQHQETEDRQTRGKPRAPNGKLEQSLEGISGHTTGDESDERRGNDCRPEEEGWFSQQQYLIWEKWRYEAQYAELRTALRKKLDRDLLNQLKQRNEEIKSNEVEWQKALKWQAFAQQRIKEQRDEIESLKRAVGAECIICRNEFGEALDCQRAHWKDCNHANICYKCTKVLWSSKKRQCPTCKTPASSMPTRLPPKIYF